MDGEGFEWWLENRLIPAFEKIYPGKKRILVMDSATNHHHMNTDYYPEKKTPDSASRKLIDTRLHLRIGLYGGLDPRAGVTWARIKVAGCWTTDMTEMSK